MDASLNPIKIKGESGAARFARRLPSKPPGKKPGKKLGKIEGFGHQNNTRMIYPKLKYLIDPVLKPTWGNAITISTTRQSVTKEKTPHQTSVPRLVNGHFQIVFRVRGPLSFIPQALILESEKKIRLLFIDISGYSNALAQGLCRDRGYMVLPGCRVTGKSPVDLLPPNFPNLTVTDFPPTGYSLPCHRPPTT